MMCWTTNSSSFFLMKDSHQRGSNKTKQNLEVPENVRLNSLALLHGHIYNNQAKIRECFKKLDDPDKAKVIEIFFCEYFILFCFCLWFLICLISDWTVVWSNWRNCWIGFLKFMENLQRKQRKIPKRKTKRGYQKQISLLKLILFFITLDIHCLFDWLMIC